MAIAQGTLRCFAIACLSADLEAQIPHTTPMQVMFRGICSACLPPLYAGCVSPNLLRKLLYSLFKKVFYCYYKQILINSKVPGK